MTRFTAQAIAVQEIPQFGVFAVIMAENADGTGDRLEIQRALSPDETDRLLGLDTYCLHAPNGTHYGGVENWELTADSLTLTLSAEAAAALGTGTECVVTVDPKHQPTLQEGLARVFADA